MIAALRNLDIICLIMSSAFSATTRNPGLACFMLLHHRTSRRLLRDNVVSLPEGDSLTISCGVCKITRDDDNGISVQVDDVPYFSTESLRRQEEGNYSFICPEGNRTITLHVLHAPERVVIKRPVTTEIDSSVNRTCHTESKPPVMYWWTNGPSAGPNIASADHDTQYNWLAAAIVGWSVAFVVLTIAVYFHYRKKAAFKKYKRFAEPSIRLATMSRQKNLDEHAAQSRNQIPEPQEERDRNSVYDLCEHL